MNRSSYDLHLHTCYSYDATMEPADYFRQARKYGLKCIAITEHHNLDSQAELREEAKQYPDIQFIPAAELSVSASTGSVDLVCLGFQEEIGTDLQGVLNTYREWVQEFGAATCRGMRALGFDFTEAHWREVLESYRPARTLDLQGQTRVANGILRKYFIERGFITDGKEYGELTSRFRNEGLTPRYPSASEVVPVVKNAGALVVIAHPVGYFGGCDRERMDTLTKELCLDGIECAHRSVPAEYRAPYRAYCEEHGLLSTAGSDCHDPEQIETYFGHHGGEEAWLEEVLERFASR